MAYAQSFAVNDVSVVYGNSSASTGQCYIYNVNGWFQDWWFVLV